MASRIIKHRKLSSRRLSKSTRCNAQNITTTLSSGAWKDETCFILGGGPSLKGFDFNLIKDFKTIGVNKSFIKFPTTVNYAMDIRFYDMVTYAKDTKWKGLHQQWLAYTGVKLFLKRSTKSQFDSSVYIVNHLVAKALSFDLQQGIYGGNNSGFGALMLAIALGCKKIGLLGFDMKVQKIAKKIETHWHGGYGFGRAESFQSKLDKFKTCFEEFVLAIRKQGISVVNLNPTSALDCFPREDLKTFLK